MSDEFLLTPESRMPLRFRLSTGSYTLNDILARLLAFGVIVPGIAWVASNYVATSPFLTGFAFRDLSAVGLFGLAGAAFAKLYGASFRG
jgi:hypothetical protein